MKHYFTHILCALSLCTVIFTSCSNDDEQSTEPIGVKSVAIINAGENGNARAEGVLDNDTFRIVVSPLSDLKNMKLEIIPNNGTTVTPGSGTVVDFESNDGKQALVAIKGTEFIKYGIRVTTSTNTDGLALLNLKVSGVYNPAINISHVEKKIKLSFSNVMGTKAILSDFEISPSTAIIKESIPAMSDDKMTIDFALEGEKYIIIANGNQERKYTIEAQISEAGMKISTAKVVLDQSLGSGLNTMLGKNTTRGAYIDGRYAFFASREGGNNIYYYDIKDATKELKTLNMGTGVIQTTNVTWPISDVIVSDKGNIYACSMAVSIAHSCVVYSLEYVDAVPEKVLEYTISDPVGNSTGVRLGDALSIIGDPKTNGYIISSNFPFQNAQQGQFYVWKGENSNLETQPQVIDLVGQYKAPSSSDLSLGLFARINGIPDDSEHFIATGSAAGTLLLNKNFNVEFEIERDKPIQGRAMDPHFFEYNGIRYLTYTINREWAPNEAFLEIVALTDGTNYVEGMKALADKSIDQVSVFKKPITSNATSGAAWLSECNSVKVVNDKVYVFGYVCEYGALVFEIGK